MKKVHFPISLLECFFRDSWANVLSLFVKLFMFHVYITIIWHLYIEINDHYHKYTCHSSLYSWFSSPILSAPGTVSSCNCQLFTVSMSSFCFTLFAYLLFLFLSPHTSEIIWYLSFSTWSVSFSIIVSRSISVANVRISFYFMAD